MHVCVCASMYMCVCMHAYVCMCVCLCMCACLCMCVCNCVYVHMCMRREGDIHIVFVIPKLARNAFSLFDDNIRSE